MLPNPSLDYGIPYEAVQEIAKSEGCRLRAYLCSAGVPTIGWGHTEGVKLGMTISQSTADDFLAADCRAFTDYVFRMCRVEPTAHQLGAMVSLAFNIGRAGFRTSTVLRQHNLRNFDAAARSFALWNKVTKGGRKVVEPGLTLRRAREASFYLTPDTPAPLGFYSMPQEVAHESRLYSSPIAQSGTVSAVTGVTAVLSSFLEPVREFAYTMDIDPLLVIGVVGIVVGVVVLWQRRKQRNEGWA